MQAYGSFPNVRLRRNRVSAFIRDLVAENSLQVQDLVYPVFILDGENRIEPILSMPGQPLFILHQLLNIAT